LLVARGLCKAVGGVHDCRVFKKVISCFSSGKGRAGDDPTLCEQGDLAENDSEELQSMNCQFLLRSDIGRRLWRWTPLFAARFAFQRDNKESIIVKEFGVKTMVLPFREEAELDEGMSESDQQGQVAQTLRFYETEKGLKGLEV
jgi:hypothetical protein